MELRDYQKEAVGAIKEDFSKNGVTRSLLVLPTGCGKTVVFCQIAKDMANLGARVLILAHRGELLSQAREKLLAFGLLSDVEKADCHASGSTAPVVVGSVQTLCSEKRLKEWKPDSFGLIIVDEAHHALSPTYQRVLDYFLSAKVLGVTATPDRGDMRGLGEYFQKISYEYSIATAIREGYLSPIRAQTIPLRIDMGAVRVQNGDYRAGDVGNVLEPYLEGIADELAVRCIGRKTVVFLPLIATSKRFCEMLNARGLKSAEVSGENGDRAEILHAFEHGDVSVLCNSMLLTEGWDCPAVDTIVVLRPTKVRALYCQMVGRGTRLYPGKTECLILDFLWHTEKHELVRPAALLCRKQDVAERMTAMQDGSEDGIMIDDGSMAEAVKDAQAEREARLKAELERQRHKKAKLVDPLQFQMSVGDDDLADYVPTFAWEMGPATEKQLETIEKCGINPDCVENKGFATMLIGRLVARNREGMSSPKQIRLLERYGFRDVGQWSRKDASRMIGRLAKNGWAVPKGVNPSAYRPGKDNG